MMWVTIYHGNGPLSLSLVIVDTLLAPFLIPLTLRILVGSRIRVDTAGMMEELILMIALPAILAMAFNQVSKGKVKEERSEEHTSELQSRFDLVCRLLLEKKNNRSH